MSSHPTFTPPASASCPAAVRPSLVGQSRARQPLIQWTSQGLYCSVGDFHIDPHRAVPRAVITHGHADHARSGSGRYFCTHSSVPLLKHRLTKSSQIQGAEYGEILEFGKALVSFHPAGHILGSAQVRIEVDGEVWVVTGDFKRDDDPTCEAFEVVPCDTFITEATFGLPIYRWPDMKLEAQEMLEWWQDGADQGLASIIYGYSLGKTQRILGELARLTDRQVWLHPAAMKLTDIYREQGIDLLPYRSLEDWPGGRSMAGELLVAPPNAGGSSMRIFGPSQTAFASGWMLIRGGGRGSRGGYDRGFVVSDHADWPTLVRTAQETGASRVFVMHGQDEVLARYLTEELGIQADSVERGLSR